LSVSYAAIYQNTINDTDDFIPDRREDMTIIVSAVSFLIISINHPRHW